nr:glycosyltransferase family 4 protein [Arthrobacter dokdonellae]
MHAVSDWGGLHENIYFAAKSLVSRGHIVDVLCTGTRLPDLLLIAGVNVLRYGLDEDSAATARRIAAVDSYDLVYCHPFVAREVGVRVAGILGIPFVASFHGNYLDAYSTWFDRARITTAVSPALVNMLCRETNVSPELVVTMRNGVDDQIFDCRILTLDEKLNISSGTYDVVVLSRLDPDKRLLWDSVFSGMALLAAQHPGRRWRIRVPGDGNGVSEADRLFTEFSRHHDNVEVEWLGWMSMSDVPRILRRSSLVFASGRGAAQGIAAGTPTIATGSQGTFGLQTGRRLDIGLWGNFGGFPIPISPWTDEGDIELVRLFGDYDSYGIEQVRSRARIAPLLRQSRIDLELGSLLEQAVG